MERQPVVLVGAGFAGSTHWIPGVTGSSPFKLIGVIDPDANARKRATEAAPGIWTAANVDDIPEDYTGTIIFIATPDHLPVIRAGARNGFRKFIIEKPLVSRDNEVPGFRGLVSGLRIYSIDHYYQKFMGLEFVLGRLTLNDPRRESLEFRGDHSREEIPGILGRVEGVSYTNIEAGDLGIPYLDGHLWVEHDPEIGGIIRDLGPHAFAPLTRVGLVGEAAEVFLVDLKRLTPGRDGFTPVRDSGDIEMFVHAVLVHEGVTANITFGKAPFPGKERSLAVRAKNGTFFAGLARGQSSVLMTNDGRTTRISLTRSENDLVLEEAAAFFEGRLPLEFEGNTNSSLAALVLGQRIREAYFVSR